MRIAFLISLALPFLAMVGAPAPLAAIAYFFAALQPELAMALVAAVVGPLVTFLVAARKFSGKIETTEAHDLWEESKNIRDWTLKRIEVLNGLVARLEKRIETLEGENDQLREDNFALHRQLDALKSSS